MDTRRTGTSVAWRDAEWKTQRTYLGTKKEIFHAEPYPMREALEIALPNGRAGQQTPVGAMLDEITYLGRSTGSYQENVAYRPRPGTVAGQTHYQESPAAG